MTSITIYTTKYCPYCIAAKDFLSQQEISFKEQPLDGKEQQRKELSKKLNNWTSVPMIFIGDQFIGGYTDMMKLHETNRLQEMLKP